MASGGKKMAGKGKLCVGDEIEVAFRVKGRIEWRPAVVLGEFIQRDIDVGFNDGSRMQVFPHAVRRPGEIGVYGRPEGDGARVEADRVNKSGDIPNPVSREAAPTRDSVRTREGAINETVGRQERLAAARKAVSRDKAPGYDGTRQMVDDVVEDPFRKGRVETVRRNARHDPVEDLFHKRDKSGARLISEGEREAGREIRRLVEVLGEAGVRAILYESIKVDGGSAPDLTARRLEAARRLSHLREYVGKEQYKLLVAIAGYGETISVAACYFEDSEEGRANGGVAARTRDRTGWLFRLSLSSAADLFGYGTARGPARGRMRAERPDDAKPKG